MCASWVPPSPSPSRSRLSPPRLLRDQCRRRHRSRHRGRGGVLPYPRNRGPAGGRDARGRPVARLLRPRAARGVRLPRGALARGGARAAAGRDRARGAGRGAGARDRWGRRAVRLVVVAGAAAGGAPGERDLVEALWRRGLPWSTRRRGRAPAGGHPGRRGGRTTGRALVSGRGTDTHRFGAELARLKDRMGRFILVEGRIRGVGERPQRTFHNFSNDWASSFTITIPGGSGAGWPSGASPPRG